MDILGINSSLLFTLDTGIEKAPKAEDFRRTFYGGLLQEVARGQADEYIANTK